MNCFRCKKKLKEQDTVFIMSGDIEVFPFCRECVDLLMLINIVNEDYTPEINEDYTPGIIEEEL